MSEITYSEYISAYKELLETYYSQTIKELYPLDNESCVYYGSIEPIVQSYASERFGFVIIIGQTLDVLENYLEDIKGKNIEFEYPKASAIAFLKDTTERIKNLVNGPEYVQHLESETLKNLGFMNQTAFYAGHEVGINILEARIDDFLQMVPLETPDPQSKLPQLPFKRKLN